MAGRPKKEPLNVKLDGGECRWRGHCMDKVEAALYGAASRACPRCGARFKPTRKTRVYCSKACCQAAIQKRCGSASRARSLQQMQADPNDKRHGTYTGYCYGCRCERCMEASKAYRAGAAK